MATPEQRAHYAVIDPTFAALNEKLPPRPPLTGADAVVVRAQMAQARAAQPKPTDQEDFSMVHEEDLTIPGRNGVEIPARLYQPKMPPSKGSPLVMMLHGGGFCFGGVEGEEINCRMFAKEFGAVCLNVLYRLAPEHPFPAAVEDSWDALQWVAANAEKLRATPSEGFIIGGTSAGGNLTDVCGHLARDEKLSPPLTGMLELIPSLCSFTVMPEKYKQYFSSHIDAKEAPVLPATAITWMQGNYKPDLQSKLYSPFIWPGGHKDLPPIAFQVCGLDMLRDGALIYEKVLREELGMKTRLQVYPGLPHGFWSFFPQLEASAGFRKDTVGNVRWLLEQKGVNP